MKSSTDIVVVVGGGGGGGGGRGNHSINHILVYLRSYN
jgi:hypothetical protein